MINYFFESPYDLTGEEFWSPYGPEHFAWLGGMGLFCLISCILFRRATEEKQDRILKFIALWIVGQEIVKDILFYMVGAFGVQYLPFHICGISIFFTFLYAFKPGKLNGAYIYGMSLPGALAALTFPNWMEFPLWHFSSLNSFTIHGELILFALLALTSGRLKPDFNQIPKLTLVMVVLAVPIYFLNKKWDTNFMFINTPSPGSPLVPLYNIFGDGYVLAAFVLLVIVWIVMFLPWKLAERKKKKYKFRKE